MTLLIVILTTLGGSVSQAQYAFPTKQACEVAAAQFQEAIKPATVQQSPLKVAGDIYQRLTFCL